MTIEYSPEDFPELTKLKSVAWQANEIEEFINWLANEKGVYLADYESSHQLTATKKPIENLLADFFGIDLTKVETERQQILDSIS